MAGTVKFIPQIKESRKELVLLSYDSKVDNFMHAADVFEPSRRLVSQKVFSFVMNKDNPESVVENFKKAAEQMGQRVVACFIIGEPRGMFVDTTCQTISTGTHWGLLADFLRGYGIEYTFEHS